MPMEKQEIIVSLIVAVFASTGFWSFVTRLLEKKSTEKSLERQALLGLLHDRVYTLGNKFIADKKISTADYDNFIYLYEPYDKLHGNGTGKKIKNAVDTLPIIND